MANGAQPERIDYFDPAIVMAFTAALLADMLKLFIFGILVPGIGLVLLAYIILAQIFAGLMLMILIMPKLKHLMPKIVLVLTWIIAIINFVPVLPVFTTGTILALLMQNRLIEFAVTQAAIIGIGIATGGTEAVVGEGAQIIGRGGQAIKAGADTVRGAEGLEQGGKIARGAGAIEEAGGTGAGRIATEDVYQTPEAQLEEGLFEKTPETPTQPAEEPAQTQPGGEQPEVGEKSEEELTRGQRAGRYAQEKIREIRDRDLGIDTRPEEEPEGAIDDETIDLREAA